MLRPMMPSTTIKGEEEVGELDPRIMIVGSSYPASPPVCWINTPLTRPPSEEAKLAVGTFLSEETFSVEAEAVTVCFFWEP